LLHLTVSFSLRKYSALRKFVIDDRFGLADIALACSHLGLRNNAVRAQLEAEINLRTYAQVTCVKPKSTLTSLLGV
jgi:hypothetical protein